jgi:hypothetical protein
MTVNTTWVSPVSGTLDKTTGNTIDETMTDALASNFYNLGGTTGYIGARVYNSANISINTATQTALTFNSEQYDSDPNAEIHSTSSNTGRLTCRTAGLYHITGNVTWAANSTGYRQLTVRVNGTTPIAQVMQQAVSTGDVTEQAVATDFVLAATEYVELLVQQSSGGALNVLTQTNWSPVFSMSKA